jgi:adenine-specific DNA-methyltransferase
VAGGSFCDPFGGVATVASTFKRAGFVVHTGDLLRFAVCFQTARVVLNEPPQPTPRLRAELGLNTPADIISELQRTKPVKSWVYREFSERRSYFTPQNAAAIDGVRRKLAAWKRHGLTDELLDAYLRACLIEAVDRVANTAGTYYAHLKTWTRKALATFQLRAMQPVAGPDGCTASVADAKDLVASRHFDVVYLDPPYNSRDYAGYYHLPETLATGRRPQPRGVSGVDAAPRPQSAFTRPARAEEAMAELIGTARYNLMVVHYSDDGLIPPRRLRSLLRSVGTVNENVITALGYGTTQKRTTAHRLYVVVP